MKTIPAFFVLLFLTTFASAQAIEVGFASHGHDASAEDLILKAIASAKKEILVASYNFTDKAILRALEEAIKRKVSVEVVHDFDASKEKGDGTRAIDSTGGKVRLDHQYKIMHDKFMVIDGKTVETGSFNYSFSAHEKNAENVIVIWNDPKVASSYKTEWDRLWAESK